MKQTLISEIENFAIDLDEAIKSKDDFAIKRIKENFMKKIDWMNSSSYDDWYDDWYSDWYGEWWSEWYEIKDLQACKNKYLLLVSEVNIFINFVDKEYLNVSCSLQSRIARFKDFLFFNNMR